MSNKRYQTQESDQNAKNEISLEYAKALKIGSTIKFLSLSFIFMVAMYGIIYAFFQGTNFIYAVVPFVLAFWLSVTRLSWLAYSPIMGVISFFSIVIPPATFLIMLLSYSRSSKYIKDNNFKMSFLGAISEQHA